MRLLPCPFCGGPAGEVGLEFITCLSAEVGAEQTCPGKQIHIDVEHADRWNVRRMAPAQSDDGYMTAAEQKAQGERCGCLGSDDYCPCQNRPDDRTKAARVAASTEKVS